MEATVIQSQNDTNVIFGVIGQYPNEISINIEYSNLFDNFFNLIGKKSYVSLINVPVYFELNYVSNNNIDLEIVEIDYLSLSNKNKKIIDDFIKLF